MSRDSIACSYARTTTSISAAGFETGARVTGVCGDVGCVVGGGLLATTGGGIGASCLGASVRAFEAAAAAAADAARASRSAAAHAELARLKWIAASPALP